jgi:hypothetical protein
MASKELDFLTKRGGSIKESICIEKKLHSYQKNESQNLKNSFEHHEELRPLVC